MKRLCTPFFECISGQAIQKVSNISKPCVVSTQFSFFTLMFFIEFQIQILHKKGSLFL